jgi:hypothetical protein
VVLAVAVVAAAVVAVAVVAAAAIVTLAASAAVPSEAAMNLMRDILVPPRTRCNKMEQNRNDDTTGSEPVHALSVKSWPLYAARHAVAHAVAHAVLHETRIV